MGSDTPAIKRAMDRFLLGWRLRVARQTLTAVWYTPEGETSEAVGYRETVRIISRLATELGHTSDPQGITYYHYTFGP